MTTITGSSTNSGVGFETINGANATTTAGEVPTSLLPSPSSNIDPGQALALLSIEQGFARRQASREARENATRVMETAQQAELKSMSDAAEARYTAAATDAWVQIGTGGVTLGSMGASFAGTELRNAPLATAGKTTFEAIRNGGADITKGVGGLVSAGERLEADRNDASAKAASFASKALENLIDDARDDERAAKETVRKALDFAREYQSAQSQSRSAALYKV